jgi:hypothetical protein
MNKADLERALKKCTGAALKTVLIKDERGNHSHIGQVYYNTDEAIVYIVAQPLGRSRDGQD